MARPRMASDEEILRAAIEVIDQRGPDAFSLSEVAKKVGLSRAAIILRFKSAAALKAKSLAVTFQRFLAALDSVPDGQGGDNLLHIAASLGAFVGNRQGSAKYFAGFGSQISGRGVPELDVQRGDVLSRAISNAMPPVAIDHDSAVEAFFGHLTGSIIAWLARDDNDPSQYLVLRTKQWLTLVGIPFSESRVDALAVSIGKRKAKSKRR